MRWTRVTGGAALALVLHGFTGIAEAVTQAQRCALAKLRAAGKAAAGAFSCHAAAARGEAPVGPCIAATHDRLLAAFARADRRQRCATRGDGELIRATIDEYRARIVGILVRPDPAGKMCEAAKWDAVADATANQIVCFRVAARENRVYDFDCLVAERLRLIDVFATLEAAGGCLGGSASEVLGDLNFLVGTVGVRLPWTRCGNGVIELGEHCDGEPLCDPSCRFAVPTCCQTTFAPGCFDASVTSCPPEFGQSVGGTVCAASGLCESVPLPPTEVCCQREETSCTSVVVTDTRGLIDAIGACPDRFGGRPVRLGTCTRRGRCTSTR